MFHNYKRRKMAELRRRVRAERLSSLEYKHCQEALSVIRAKVSTGVSEIALVVGFYYPDHHNDIRGIHERLGSLITHAAGAGFSGPGTIQEMIKNLLWMSTVVPENQNHKIKTVVDFLTQYQYKRWGVV